MARAPAASARSEQAARRPHRRGQQTFRRRAVGQLGNRPVGPHPARDRSGARQPARHRGGAARSRPDPGLLGDRSATSPCSISTAGCGSRRRPSPAGTNTSPCSGGGSRAASSPTSRCRRSLAEYEIRARHDPATASSSIAQQEDALVGPAGPQSGADRARQQPRQPRLARPSPASLPAELLTRRPDILQAEQHLVASNALIGAARALYFPRISLTGLGRLRQRGAGGPVHGLGAHLVVRRRCRRPDLHRRRARRGDGQAEARREQALAAYELTIQNAFRDVEDALVAVQTSREVEESFERRVASPETRREAGARALRQRLFRLSRRARYRAEPVFRAACRSPPRAADRYRALVNLYRALGGDWVDEAAPWRPDQASESAGGNSHEPLHDDFARAMTGDVGTGAAMIDRHTPASATAARTRTPEPDPAEADVP